MPHRNAFAIARDLVHVHPRRLRRLTIATCADAPTGSTVDDTLLDVYTSSTGNCGGVMTPIACDDDACTGENLQSVLTTNLTAGTPLIVVHKWDNVAPTAGNTAIQLRVTLSTPPANDEFA